MRPGRIRPGKDAIINALDTEFPSFNEAGADPPRKVSVAKFRDTVMPPSFNEAGADPPRKDPIICVADRQDDPSGLQ